MFGMKIRTWMEAHIARSRGKKKDKRNLDFQQQQQLYQQQFILQQQQQQQQQEQQRHEYYRQQYQLQQHHFTSYDNQDEEGEDDRQDVERAKVCGRRRNDFVEARPSFSVSSTSSSSPRSSTCLARSSASSSSGYRTSPQHPHRSSAAGGQRGTKAVNLSSPESAYSTGYSTDGTSLSTGVTSAPGVNFANRQSPDTTNLHGNAGSLRRGTGTGRQQQTFVKQQQQQPIPPPRSTSRERSYAQARNNCIRELQMVQAQGHGVAGGGTCTKSSPAPIRHPTNYIEQQQQHHHHHQTSRPLAVQSHLYGNEVPSRHRQWTRQSPPSVTNNSPRNSPLAHSVVNSAHRSNIANNNSLNFNHLRGSYQSPPQTNSCIYLSSPGRRLAQQNQQQQQFRPRVRTNPWLTGQYPGNARHQYGNYNFYNFNNNNNNVGHNQNQRRNLSARFERCCRQESRSVGQSPVNRGDWCYSPPRFQNFCRTSLPRRRGLGSSNSPLSTSTSKSSRSSSTTSTKSNGSSTSSGSNCSNRNLRVGANARASNSNEGSNESSGSTGSRRSSRISSCDEDTLNDIIGRFDENYCHDGARETAILDNRADDTDDGGAELESDSFSWDYLDLEEENDDGCGWDDAGGRRRRPSPRRFHPNDARQSKRKKGSRVPRVRDEDQVDHISREEMEIMQHMLRDRKHKKSGDPMLAAGKNRALLERLLVRNALMGGGGGAGGTELAQHLRGRTAGLSYLAEIQSPPSVSRSAGGTPVFLRRKRQQRQQMLAASSPSRHLVKKSPICQKENMHGKKKISASELALIEADKEADRKYQELIMEAEKMLLNVQYQLRLDNEGSHRGSTSSITTSSFAESSPSHNSFSHPSSGGTSSSNKHYSTNDSSYNSQHPLLPHNYYRHTMTAPNKRVESIKNAELNIEMALSKSRNPHPEFASGNIKDLQDHFSPKRLIHQNKNKDPASVSIPPTTHSQASPKRFTSDRQTVSENERYDFPCPQSEPLRRKTYETAALRQSRNTPTSGGTLQRYHGTWVKSSDSEFATSESTNDNQSSSSVSSDPNVRKHVLLQTLQDLKQSLQDQSADLKKSCLQQPL